MPETSIQDLRELALRHDPPNRTTFRRPDIMALIDTIEQLASERDMAMQIAPVLVRDALTQVAEMLNIGVTDDMTNDDISDAIHRAIGDVCVRKTRQPESAVRR